MTVSQAQENGSSKETFVKPQLKPVPPKDTTKLQSKEVKVPIKLNSVKNSPAKAEDKRLQSLKSEDPEAIDKVCKLTEEAQKQKQKQTKIVSFLFLFCLI